MAFHGSIYASEAHNPEQSKNRAHLYSSDHFPCRIDKLLVLLNDLGDDWWCCRRARVEEFCAERYSTCSFRLVTRDRYEIYMRYRLLRDYRAPGPVFMLIPDVSLSFAWINWPASNPSRVPAGDQDSGQNDHEAAVQEAAGEEPPQELDARNYRKTRAK
jgi:hypothetical protein